MKVEINELKEIVEEIELCSICERIGGPITAPNLIKQHLEHRKMCRMQNITTKEEAILLAQKLLKFYSGDEFIVQIKCLIEDYRENLLRLKSGEIYTLNEHENRFWVKIMRH